MTTVSTGGYTNLALVAALTERGLPTDPEAPAIPVPPGLVLTLSDDLGTVAVECGPAAPYRLDALPWAIASRQAGVDVLVRELRPGRAAVELTRDTAPLKPEDDLRTAALRVADLLIAYLSNRGGRLPTIPVGPGAAGVPGAPLLPYGEIDWTAPARRIASLVRALSHPAPGAWTARDGVRLIVREAHPTDLPTAFAPPGTVLAATGTGLLVQTGDQVLHVSDLHDPIGPVDADLPPGSRLGLDPGAEVDALRQRVTDLEHVVHLLSKRVPLLG